MITVKANSITLTDDNKTRRAIQSTAGIGATGKAGYISLNTDQLSVTNANVTVSGTGKNSAGDVIVMPININASLNVSLNNGAITAKTDSPSRPGSEIPFPPAPKFTPFR